MRSIFNRYNICGAAISRAISTEEPMPGAERIRSKRSRLICLIVIPLWLSAFLPASARGASASAVDQALSKAKAFLYSKMNNANWETSDKRSPTADKASLVGGQWGGATSLAVYALLASGEDAQDPKLAPSIAWLKTADIAGTYALSMRCQVWLMMPRTVETRKLAEADRDRIQHAYNSGISKGAFLYTYLTNKRDNNLVDHSVSQFGVLSMWACAAGDRDPDGLLDGCGETLDGRPAGRWRLVLCRESSGSR